ncbi:ARM repeat-containing protein [Tothia fuscella]|uniref:ARM repeat-containing protein n=1 Tax=Tothia fuscella TaxID=1048955 RepID=A0A9P4NHD0_9PEZI|nr:ARM repeat-containing protein [Tothia fuscella]
MARAEVPKSLQEIRNPTSVSNQIAALKQLKHDIIGHDQRKELVVRHGIIGALVRNLTDRTAVRGKRRSEDDGGAEEDEIRVQSIQIITSLAHGGLAFIHPLLHGGVIQIVDKEAIQPLLSTLSPSTNQPKLILETLKCINAMAEALSTEVDSPEDTYMYHLSSQLYSKPTIDSLAEIVAQRARSMTVDDQVTLVMKIVNHTLRSAEGSTHHRALVKAGVLDCLASRLAGLVIKMGLASSALDQSFISSLLPATSRTNLVPMLEVLATITKDSAYRSLRLLCSSSMLGVFPIASATSQQRSDDQYMTFTDERQSSEPTTTNRLDYLLPKLQAVQNKNEHNFSKAFPVLGSLSSQSDLSRMPYFNETQAMVSSRTISADEFGSGLFAWLVIVARTTTGMERLAALELLTHLVSALDKNVMDSWADSPRNRDRTLAFLAVPLLVRVMEETSSKLLPKEINTNDERWTVKERVPMVLAVLVEDCPSLQKAAVDANAIKMLCQMLKKSFDPVVLAKKPMWSPNPHRPTEGLDEDGYNLHSAALAPEAIHMLRCRAAALRGLSAIAQKEDIHRKSVIDNGVVNCVVESLVRYPDGSLDSIRQQYSGSSQPKGNPNFVIVEACRLATALSRSVSILRTSLIDGGVAKPIFALLVSGSRAVRVCATDAVTNLVLQFSPMREELMSQGILKILCNHALWADAEMRVSSLWALKHLANSAPNEVKISIIEELGTEWLIRSMSGEGTSSSGFHHSHLATPNAAGQQVDLLNSVDDQPGMDMDESGSAGDSSEDEDEDAMIDSIGELPRPIAIPSQYRTRLKAIQQEEENPIIIARRDEIRVQEQVLDLVRNLISEAGPAQPEMIDHLLQSMGAQRLFECLANKLKPKSGSAAPATTPPRTRTTGTAIPAGKRPTLTTPGSTSQTQTPQQPFPEHLYIDAKLLESVIFILIHIANGKPQHRHILLSQTTTPTPLPSVTTTPPFSSQYTHLIDLTLPLFSHPGRRIRVACCWLVHNLMWMEDQSDANGAKGRALELRSRGFEEEVRRCVGDGDLDVRERARGCIEVWGRLLEGGNGERSGLGIGGGGRGGGWER